MTGKNTPDANVIKERDAERRRRALRETLSAAEMTPTEAARAARLPTPNAIFNFLNGRSRTLSQVTLEKLAEVIPGATIAALIGIDPVADVGPPVASIQVRAVAAAGLMQGAFDLPLRHQSQVSMPIAPDFHTAGAFGVSVREPGAEKLFPEGSILACVPLQSYDGQLKHGSKVILQRTVGGRVEVTVRELDLHANEAWLWLRSTHHEHQAPVRMPYTPGQLPQPWRDGDVRFNLAAIAVGVYMPLV